MADKVEQFDIDSVKCNIPVVAPRKIDIETHTPVTIAITPFDTGPTLRNLAMRIKTPTIPPSDGAYSLVAPGEPGQLFVDDGSDDYIPNEMPLCTAASCNVVNCKPKKKAKNR